MLSTSSRPHRPCTLPYASAPLFLQTVGRSRPPTAVPSVGDSLSRVRSGVLQLSSFDFVFLFGFAFVSDPFHFSFVLILVTYFQLLFLHSVFLS